MGGASVELLNGLVASSPDQVNAILARFLAISGPG